MVVCDVSSFLFERKCHKTHLFEDLISETLGLGFVRAVRVVWLPHKCRVRDLGLGLGSELGVGSELELGLG